MEFTKNMFEAIVQDPDIHARWLNSISYLEYRGFRKIARSQKTSHINLEILNHAYEEVRHAIFFKKLAMRLGGSSFADYSESNMLAASSAKSYFFELDSNIDTEIQKHNNIPDSYENYILVTWLIEERAMQVYKLYQQVLEQEQSEIRLRPVLVEEEKHLEEMKERVSNITWLGSDGLRRVRELEDAVFSKFAHACKSEVQRFHLGSDEISSSL